MTLKTTWVEYGPSHALRGYLAYPTRAALPLPAVIVGQEAWGVDEHIEDVVQRFAAAGYVAFAPDLFAVGGTRPPDLARERLHEVQVFANSLPSGAAFNPAARAPALAERPAAERERLEQTLGALGAMFGKGIAQFLPTMQSAFAYLRDSDLARGKPIGCVGYCMGGGLAALLACHEPKLSGAVIYYGNAPPDSAIPNIQCPILGFYGGLDTRITSAVPAFEEAMKKANKKFTPSIYAKAEHAFANDRRPAYDVDATRDAFAKTLAFFNGMV